VGSADFDPGAPGSKKDTVVAGAQVRAGTSVPVLLGAANDGPAVFPAPGKFDLHRQGSTGLGFGLGPRICLGKLLAKLELTPALRAILEPFMRIRLVDEEPPRFESLTYREFTTFPVIHGLNHHYEAALQLRGEAANRQVRNVEISLVTTGAGPSGGAILYGVDR
jgi:hypothetical protein